MLRREIRNYPFLFFMSLKSAFEMLKGVKGSTSILEKTDFIILEIPLFGKYNEGVPTFLEHITYMNSIGFVVYDIIDNHYINNFNMQVDILFINKNHEFNVIVNNLLL